MKSASLAIVLIASLSATYSSAQITKAELQNQAARAEVYMFNNISPQGGARGSVAASPSRSEPNYFYHWVRDAALVMNVVHDLYSRAPADSKDKYLNTLRDFVYFSRANQLTHTLTDLGEPKFHMDGSSYTDPWGRPQNDGPALRAIVLTRLARTYLERGDWTYVRSQLYNGGLPASTVIKADLEYVAHHWRESNFDVWEEVKGDHFYNGMVQRKALIEGAELAQILGDIEAANFYRLQASAIESHLNQFYDSSRQYIMATLHRTDGIDYKSSNLDTVVLLASLHGSRADGFFEPTDARVLATAQAISDTFRDIYYVNHTNVRGVVVGRYPEDRYDGYRTSSMGNPWFLTTHALAEVYYKAARAFKKSGNIQINETNLKFFQSLSNEVSSQVWSGRTLVSNERTFHTIVGRMIARGDECMERSLMHMDHGSGAMSEQMNRYSGFMQGAYDLTWSYASYLTAVHARAEL